MMRWNLSEAYNDPHGVIDFLLMKLIRYDDRGSLPSELAKSLHLTKEQIRALVKWLELVISEMRGFPLVNSYEAESFSEWRVLIRTQQEF